MRKLSMVSVLATAVLAVVPLTAAPAAAGEPTWVNIEANPANTPAIGSKVAVDSATGTVWVAGQTATRPGGLYADALLLTAYNASGTRLQYRIWDLPGVESQETPMGITIDPVSGTVYVAVALYLARSSAILSFARDGRLNWVRQLPAQSGEDVTFTDVEHDPGSGNVFLSGYVSSDDDPVRAITLGYDPQGRLLWQRRAATDPSGGGSTAQDVAIDPARGIVYSAGGGGNGARLQAYDRSGTPLWSASPASAYRYGELAVDRRSGTAYLVGYAGSEGADDYLTVAYTPTGEVRWTRQEDGGRNDRPVAVGVDTRSGAVFVTGSSSKPGEGAVDYLTVSYTASGTVAWRQRFGASGDTFDEPTALVVDAKRGIVYVTGSNATGPGLADPAEMATVSYSTSGKQLRVDRFQRTGDVYPLAMAVDLVRGQVAITGVTYAEVNEVGLSDPITLSYPPAR